MVQRIVGWLTGVFQITNLNECQGENDAIIYKNTLLTKNMINYIISGIKRRHKKMARKKMKKRRPNGFGTLEKRANGIWIARWTVDGQSYSKSTGITIRAEAEKKLAEFVKPFQEKSKIAQLRQIEAKIKCIEDGIDADERQKPALRMADALDAYFASPSVNRMSEGAMGVYTHKFNRLMHFIKRQKRVKVVEMRDFTPKMADLFLAELKQTTKVATYNQYLDFFRRLWRVLSKDAKQPINPWMEYKKQKGGSTSRENLTTEEVRRVIDCADDEMKILLNLGYYTGLRISDCSLIRGANFKLKEGVISIVPKKTNRGRPEPLTIPIHKDLMEAIDGHLPKDPEDYVLPECARLYLNGSLNYHVKQLFEKCGIETSKVGVDGRSVCLRSFHSLRSGFVTNAASAKIPFPVISAISGHTSLKMCHKYYRTSKENLVQCINAIPSLNDGESQPKTSLIISAEVFEALETVRHKDEQVEDCLRRLVDAVKAKPKEEKPQQINKPFWSMLQPLQKVS